MKNASITDKLISYFVILGVIVIVIIGSYSYYFAKKALIDRTFAQLISLRLEKKNRIEQFFMDRVSDVNLISKSEEIKKIIEVLNSKEKGFDEINIKQYNSYLSNYIRSHGYYQKLYVVGNNDLVFDINTANGNSTEDNVDRLSENNLKSFCKEVMVAKKTIIHDLTRSKLLIYIGSPILNNTNKIIGFIVLEIPVTAINKIMFEHTGNNGLGRTGETYLVGSDYLMRSNSRFEKNAVFNINVKSKAVIDAFDGKTDISIVNDYRNISCLSSYSKINTKGLNWVILAEIDEHEAMVPIDAIRNSILLISVIIAGVVFIFAMFISMKITLPLKNLQKASEQIGERNYDIKLEITSMDEIGLLTDAFNTMTARLKKQSLQIEEEKTKRISSLIDGQEMERQRLSRDLHDSLGQSILAVKIKLEQAKNTDVQKSQSIITEAKELLKGTIQEIRNISNDLMPPVLEAFGLELGLKNLCKDTTTNTGINILFTSKDLPDTLDKKTQIYLYRISQEAINNITKHSQASEASLSISYSEDSIALDITDNGKGFDEGDININANGIINIKQRVEILKGTLSLESPLGKGTAIKIQIPIC